MESNLATIPDSRDVLRHTASICEMCRKSDVLSTPRSMHCSVSLIGTPNKEVMDIHANRLQQDNGKIKIAQ